MALRLIHPPAYADHREHVARLIGAALHAADPEAAVLHHLRPARHGVRIAGRLFPLPPGSKVYLLALGKAAPAMARAACAILAERLTAGIVTALTPKPVGAPDRVQVILAGHPLPDSGSVRAGQAMLALARTARANDLILALISGGGSAMAECPVPGVTLEDVRQLTGRLLFAGAPITAINTIRGALSMIKAGGLARAAAPAQVIGLLLSDVVGDDPAAIASGPTVPRSPLHAAARRMLERYGCWDSAPEAIRHALRQPVARMGKAPRVHNVVIARNADLVGAAAREAQALGFPTQILTARMQGEAFVVGGQLGARLRSAARPACLLAGGETTVTIRQGGRGGRNQELTLGAALALDGVPRCLLVSLASDGIDGPTDAAGAWVDGETVSRGRALGLDLQRAAQAHDSYPALDALEALLHTGPTGSNLADLVFGLAYA